MPTLTRTPTLRGLRQPEPSVSHPVLLTGLTVVGLWSLLLVLITGLYQILQALESIRTTMEKISMGVRAIEEETGPLGSGIDQLAGSLTAGGGGLSVIADRVGDLTRDLKAAGPILRQLG